MSVSARAPSSALGDQSRRYHSGSLLSDFETFVDQGLTGRRLPFPYLSRAGDERLLPVLAEAPYRRCRKWCTQRGLVIVGVHWRALRNEYWPAIYVVDGRGQIRDRAFGEVHIGTGQDKDLSRLVEKLLAEAAGPKT